MRADQHYPQPRRYPDNAETYSINHGEQCETRMIFTLFGLISGVSRHSLCLRQSEDYQAWYFAKRLHNEDFGQLHVLLDKPNFCVLVNRRSTMRVETIRQSAR
jgi:hypothetical protein